MPESKPHLFERAFQRYGRGMLEYRDFLSKYKPTIPTFEASNPLFRELKNIYGLDIDDRHPEYAERRFSRSKYGVPIPPTLQISFLRRPYRWGRLTYDYKIPREMGAKLLYSPGPNGMIATLLFPARGDLGDVIDERAIIIRSGFYTSYQLQRFLWRDLHDLTTYAVVSTIDGSPTFRQRLRVRWLRISRPKVPQDQAKAAGGGTGLYEFASVSGKTVIIAALTAIFKPIGTIAAILLIGLLSTCTVLEHFNIDWAGQYGIEGRDD